MMDNRPYLQGINESPSRVLAQTFSDPFTVFSAKKFPGMIGTFTDIQK
jgi:Velvet factor